MLDRRHTRIKICGITTLADAQLVVRMGADAIGFVFYPSSPRYISPEQAQQIILKLPVFVNIVGLFVDASADFVHNVIQHVQIDTLQFHGDEDEIFCNQYHKPYIKVLRVSMGDHIEDQIAGYPSASAILFDSYIADMPGGTGKVFDWSQIPETLAHPIILAGGLNAKNVQQAIQQVQPYAVDVSSGVESKIGHKDQHKVASFIKCVHTV